MKSISSFSKENQCITNVTTHFTPAASLAALGIKLQQLKVDETQAPTGLRRYGIVRMVRDIFHISSSLSFDALGNVVEIRLNQDAFLAHLILPSLRQVLLPMQIAVNLDKI